MRIFSFFFNELAMSDVRIVDGVMRRRGVQQVHVVDDEGADLIKGRRTMKAQV